MELNWKKVEPSGPYAECTDTEIGTLSSKNPSYAIIGKNKEGKYSLWAVGPDEDEEGGHIASDLENKDEAKEAAVEAMEELEVSGFEDLRDELDIKDDGLWVLTSYMEKHCEDLEDNASVKETLESFKSDVEEYAMPAVDEMLAFLEENE